MSQWLDLRQLPAATAWEIISRSLEEGLPLTAVIDDSDIVNRVASRARDLNLTARVTQKGKDYWLNLEGEVLANPGLSGGVGFVVLIAHSTWGGGAQEYGGLLMARYLYALTQSEFPPSHIILVNEGVTLAAQSSPVVSYLRSLAAQGCSILCSETCVEHYHVAMGAGVKASMLQISETMALASKVISI